MKYLELWERVRVSGRDPKVLIHYGKHSVSGRELAPVPYNIVLRDGKYRIFGSDERQNFHPLHFSIGGPEVEFDTEEEMCDYIWVEINTPLPPPGKLPKRTQAEWDAMRAEMERSVRASRDAYLKEHSLE